MASTDVKSVLQFAACSNSGAMQNLTQGMFNSARLGVHMYRVGFRS